MTILKNITGVLGAVAPGLAQSMGGPLGSVAMGVLSKVLSKDGKKVEATEESIGEALKSPTPEQLLEIKKAELDYQEKLKELDIDMQKVTNADIQSARTVFAKDWTPKVFAMGILVGFFCFVFYIVSSPWSREMEPIMNIILGGLLANLASVVSYYFGNSHSPGDSK